MVRIREKNAHICTEINMISSFIIYFSKKKKLFLFWSSNLVQKIIYKFLLWRTAHAIYLWVDKVQHCTTKCDVTWLDKTMLSFFMVQSFFLLVFLKSGIYLSHKTKELLFL